MIGFLSGVVQYTEIDAVCINVNGVGYRVFMALPDVARFANAGTKVEAYIHTNVREDAIILYGFSARDQLALFERLTSVQGVGPKMGLSMLSGMDPDSLVRAIA